MSDVKVAVGNIVLITYPKGKFTGKQGKVVEISDDNHKDGPIGVIFPEYYTDLFMHPDFGSIVRFEEDDLEKVDASGEQNISLELRLKILFGNMVNYYFPLEHSLIIGHTDCMHQGCVKKAVARIMVNCHGSVSDVDVCEDHFEWHGRNCDGFPYKQEHEWHTDIITEENIKSQEEMFNDIFGVGKWHEYNQLDYPLMIGFTDCSCKDCERKATGRILVNCHGYILEVDVCSDHFKWYGGNGDKFPFRDDPALTAAILGTCVD